MRMSLLLIAGVALWASTMTARAAEPTVAELAAQVKTAAEPAKVVALDQLTLLQAKAAAAVPELTAALKDPSAIVRAHAAQALGAIGAAAKPAASALVALTADPDQVVRREAIEALGRIQPDPQVTIPLFVKLLESNDPQTRHAALPILSAQGPAAVPYLIKALAHPQGVYWACLVLRHMGAEAQAAVPALTKLLDDARPEVRREAILALAEIDPAHAPALPQILRALDDPDTKTAAIFALGAYGKADAAAEAKIQQNMKDADPVLSTVSMWALARLRPDDKKLLAEVTARLCDALKSSNPQARKAAARALGSLKPNAEIFVPALEKALKGADEANVHDALEALAGLGPATVPELIGALKYEKVRPYVVNLLGQQGPAAKPAVDALSKLLDDKNPDVQREAALALGRIGPDAKAAVPTLLQHFTANMDREGEVCCGIAFALGRIGDPAAVPALTKALDNSDQRLAVFSAWALVQIEPKNAELAAKVVPLLVKGLQAAEPRFRCGAAEALKAVGPQAKAALPALQQAAKDEDPTVRAAVEAAIHAIGG